jgi:hypothetical protein
MLLRVIHGTAYLGSKFPTSIKKGTHPLRRVPFCQEMANVPIYNRGTSNSATMLMILMSGLIAGPAVSL